MYTYVYSGTSELQTLRDHVKVSAIWRCVLYTVSAPSNVMTLSSYHMSRVQKLSVHEHSLSEERA